ncbi:MAG TPA: PaaI family thioesterase [Porticoccaceae bacterium]|nr:PaaI family thioesterase [Porticoccaceae bacterium]
MTDQQFIERVLAFRAKPENQSPHARFLGLEIVSLERGRGVMRIPYHADLAGNATSGVLHGGVITTVLDAVCGLSVIAALERPATIATLDLRIDYLKPATPGAAVTAAGHCYKVTRNICFVRAQAYHEDAEDPIAHCAASFMITSERTGEARAEATR